MAGTCRECTFFIFASCEPLTNSGFRNDGYIDQKGSDHFCPRKIFFAIWSGNIYFFNITFKNMKETHQSSLKSVQGVKMTISKNSFVYFISCESDRLDYFVKYQIISTQLIFSSPSFLHIHS